MRTMFRLRQRAHRCGRCSGSRGAGPDRWMQLGLVARSADVARRPARRRAASSTAVGREHAGGERVEHPDGDLLLQPEPVRGRVAEGRAGGGREAGHPARRLRREQQPADAGHADPGRDHHRQVQGFLGLGPRRHRAYAGHQQGDQRGHQGRVRRLHVGHAGAAEHPERHLDLRHDHRPGDRRGGDKPGDHDELGLHRRPWAAVTATSPSCPGSPTTRPTRIAKTR